MKPKAKRRAATKRDWKRILRWAALIGGSAAVLMIALVFFCNWRVVSIASDRVHQSADTLPANDVGLVLGCRKTMDNGLQNLFFVYRVRAAAELYHAGKIKRIIVSGDNHAMSYNEPLDMRNDLIKLGVPARSIYLDYAGFRTLDSIVRARDIFGQTKFTIISQENHNYRAVYLATQKDIDAVAYNAKAVSLRGSLKTRIREAFARTLAVADVGFLDRQPKFSGSKVTIH